MLSILIPVYNFDIRKLAGTLLGQCRKSALPFEILCFDDGSEEIFLLKNREISNWQGVSYRELPENLGRSRIRNELAAQASYSYLLFMDCDSKVVSGDYIATYVEKCDPGSLLYGGRVYPERPPANRQLYLHWHYGRRREQIPTALRQQSPYQSFMTNNFLVPKAIFEKIRFDGRLTQYGHEDTIFGLELEKLAIPIHHIDNPLEHLGLEDAPGFLLKTEKAIENLYFLSRSNPIIDTRLLRMFERLKKMGLSRVLYRTLQPLQPFIGKNLKSGRPSLSLFDIYKLCLLLKQHNCHEVDKFDESVF